MQNILFFLLCALLTGCHSGTSRPELPEMVEYSGPNASSLRTFIESIEVIKLDHRESITVGAYNAIRSDSNSFYVGDMLNGSNLVYRSSSDRQPIIKRPVDRSCRYASARNF